jgi:hypothetical protein
MSCAAPERDLLVFLAARTLEAGEEKAALQHVASCPECKEDLAEALHLARGVRSLHLTSEEVVDAAWAGTRSAHLDACPQCDADVKAVQRSNEELDRSALPRRLAGGAQALPWSRLGSALSSPRLAYSGMAASLALAVILGQNVNRLQTENRRLVQEQDHSLPQGAPAAALAEAQRERESAERRSATLQARIDQLSQPQLNVPIVNLEPSGARRGDLSATPKVELPAGAGLVTVVLHLDQARKESSYAVEIRDAHGRSVWRGNGLVKSAFDTFTLALPRTPFPAGLYEIRLSAEHGAGSTLVETYALHLGYR